MAGSRTLKVSILADVADLTKGLNSGAKDVEGFGDKLTKFGKLAGAAFLAAGAAAAAYAGKLAVDGVKAAIEDEAAQAKLATTLKNVTGATEAQIFATEDYITQTSLATGVTDDELRPSLERLARATGDVTQAQQLQTLALDIAAGTGKSLEAVSQALGKAYEGNATSLGKLGLGIDSATLKTMSFDEVTATLSKTFEGQATKQADTFAGRMQRLNVAFSEAKETVGSYILGALTPLLEISVNQIIPTLQTLAADIGEKVGPAFFKIAQFVKNDLLPVLQSWWSFIWDTVIPGIVNFFAPILAGLFSAFNKISDSLKDNEKELKPLFDALKAFAGFVASTLAPAIGKILGGAFDVLGSAISAVVGGISALVSGVNSAISAIRRLASAIANSPVGAAAGALLDFAIPGRASGGPVAANRPYVVGERGPELFVPKANGTIVPNNAMGGNTFNITVNGAIDAEGTARAINDVLRNSAARTGAYNTLGRAALAV